MIITIQSQLTQVIQGLSRFSTTPVLDAQVLLADIIEKPRSWALAHPEEILDQSKVDRTAEALYRLQHGEPLPYVIGHWEFYGLDFKLSPQVLIPRPETELLVERGMSWLRLNPRRHTAVDVGTGSGCIGVALAVNIPDLHVLFTDLSAPALALARENAQHYGLEARSNFLQADLLAGITSQFDLVCANLPYIPTGILPTLPVAASEPLLALDGGPDGIRLISRLLDQVRQIINPGGLILLEIESSRGADVKKLAENLYPASSVLVLPDLSGRDRCVEVKCTNLIVHMCSREDWLSAQGMQAYASRSLRRDGFIHCSRPDQILQVANRFYQGSPDLVLLWVDPQELSSEIRWELADSMAFPHIYGPINQEAVVGITNFPPDADGVFRQLQPPLELKKAG